jgi:hypothetical protein
MLIKLTVEYDTAQKAVRVTGPIDEEVLCLGMLEKAKDSVRAHNAAKAGIEIARSLNDDSTGNSGPSATYSGR